MAKYFFSRQVAVYLVLRCQIRGKRNWKGPLCVTCNNKALQHELWEARAPQELCWSKWQQKLWRAAPCHHGPPSPGRAGDTSRVINAAWKAGWFWSAVSQGASWTQQKHSDLPDALDSSSAFWSIIGTKHLRYLHQKCSTCSSPPASSPTAADGKKLNDLGKFVGIQTPSRGEQVFPCHKVLSFPHSKEPLHYLQNVPQTLMYSPKSGASISPKTAPNAVALPWSFFPDSQQPTMIEQSKLPSSLLSHAITNWQQCSIARAAFQSPTIGPGNPGGPGSGMICRRELNGALTGLGTERRQFGNGNLTRPRITI